MLYPLNDTHRTSDMNSKGQLFSEHQLQNKSGLMTAYEKLCESNFKNIEKFSQEELDWLQQIHNRYLEFYKEERRMHFGAMALVAILLIILLPATLTIEKYVLPLAVTQLLLLILLIPYIFVYRRYEEGVRKKMRQAIVLENARRAQKETR